MNVYLNFPLLCLIHTKSLVLGQRMYHSYQTYDHYSQSDENDYSHSTTASPFLFYDFLAEAKNSTELAEKLEPMMGDYHHLSYCIEHVDRAHYTLDNPYHMRPSSVGFNAHMDSPEVVAKACVLLMDHFEYPNTSKTLYPKSRQNLKVLDIGCGTGYMTTIFGHLVGHSGEVIGIDHVPELIKLAHMALDYDHWHFLESERVKFIVKDGSKGHKEEGPYDIIHLGASTVDVPQEILEQLKPGGRLLYHKGIHFGHVQYLTYIDRLANGTFAPEVIDYEIEHPLEGLMPFKSQMDEFKLKLQGKFKKRYRIDDPQEDIRHALDIDRFGHTINIFSISPRKVVNYTGYTHEFRTDFDSRRMAAEGLERSDMIP